MQQCYDWQSNVLKFTDVNGNKYNLKFRGNKTIVHGIVQRENLYCALC